MDKVSIIVPVYNSERYIKKCVDSIINQTYKNIEIILINDGSSDNSFKIIKELALKNKNIICYNQDNCGVSVTRNKGIRYATGKYVMFVDNDDYLDNDYVETFMNSMNEKHYDYIIGGYKRVDTNGKTFFKKSFKNENWSYYMFVTPWGKIFDRNFLLENNIEYLNVGIGEDIYFNILAISYSKNKKVINNTGYNWFYNTSSISNTVHRKNDKKNKDDLLFLFDKIIQNINKNYLLKNENFLKYFLLKTTIWYTLYSCKKNDAGETYKNYLILINFISNNISPCYKDMLKFNPKGESFKVRFVVFVFIVLDKLKLLKFFIYLYSMI